MRLTRWTFISILAAFACLGTPSLSAEDSHGTRFRWDIFQLEGLGTPTITAVAGGTSISAATFSPIQPGGDNSTITLTGSGTFRLNGGRDVTGGGTWETATSTGTITGAGTYRVTELERFDVAPGTLVGTGIADGIGNATDTRAGLAVMKVTYSDGEKGTLVVSCDLLGTPASVFEGTTATKGFVSYFNPVFPDFTFGNTLFHVIHED
jgi:hypothetical protein